MGSEEEPSSLEKYLIFSETHTKSIKVITYGISGITLAIALHRIRPFSKFRNPSSIPSHFFHKKVPLQGTVKRIEPSHGTLLMVDHKPLIALPRLNNKTFLPIKIAGLNVTSNGINWLQAIINGQSISFVPLFSTKEYLSCIIVTASQQNKEQIRIGEDLIRLGFAVVEQDSLKSMLDDKNVLYYQKRLLNAQKRAKRERNGYWQFTKKPTLLWKVQQNLNEQIKRILSKFPYLNFQK